LDNRDGIIPGRETFGCLCMTRLLVFSLSGKA